MKELVLQRFKETVQTAWVYFLDYQAEHKEFQYKLWCSKSDIKFELRDLLIADGMTAHELDEIEDEIKLKMLSLYR